MSKGELTLPYFYRSFLCYQSGIPYRSIRSLALDPTDEVNNLPQANPQTTFDTTPSAIYDIPIDDCYVASLSWCSALHVEPFSPTDGSSRVDVMIGTFSSPCGSKTPLEVRRSLQTTPLRCCLRLSWTPAILHSLQRFPDNFGGSTKASLADRANIDPYYHSSVSNSPYNHEANHIHPFFLKYDPSIPALTIPDGHLNTASDHRGIPRSCNYHGACLPLTPSVATRATRLGCEDLVAPNGLGGRDEPGPYRRTGFIPLDN